MYLSLKAVIGIIVCVCLSTPVMADWKVYKSARVKSSEKCTLKIEKDGSGPIFAWFVLSEDENGVFESQFPIYQVDDHKVHPLRFAENRKTDKMKRRWIRWKISDGKARPSEALIELISGKKVVFQYYLPDGTIKETIFDIKGAKEAVGEIDKRIY